MAPPSLIIIAGPNGVGKTTFAEVMFPAFIDNNRFLNADRLAKDLSLEESPIKAGHLIIEERNRLVKNKESFVLETTLATLSLGGYIKKCSEEGYLTYLHYLWVTSPALCDFRVKVRVVKGGHNIPIETIFRRYFKSVKYLNKYTSLVKEAHIYLADSHPKLIAIKTANKMNITGLDFNQI